MCPLHILWPTLHIESMRTGHVSMLVSIFLCFTQPDTIDDGGMIQFITNHCIFRCEQSFEQSCIRIETTDIRNGVFAFMELRNLAFQFFVYILETIREPYKCLLHFLLHFVFVSYILFIFRECVTRASASKRIWCLCIRIQSEI